MTDDWLVLLILIVAALAVARFFNLDSPALIEKSEAELDREIDSLLREFEELEIMVQIRDQFLMDGKRISNKMYLGDDWVKIQFPIRPRGW